MLCCDGVRRCCFVGGAGWAALMLISRNPGGVTLELAAAPACWLSTAGNMEVNRRTDIIMSARWVASFSKIFVSGLERLCERR